MALTDQMKKILEENKIALQNAEMEKFFKVISNSLRKDFSEFFLVDLGYDFLKYMKAIPACCFENSELSELNIPDNITAINENAFKGSKLQKIELPKTIFSIGNGAFENCYALEEVKIPEGITTIPKDCFKNCTALKTLFLPKSVTTINAGAFDNCDDLIIVTPWRENPNEKLRVRESNQEWFKQHLKFRH